jgi:ABC-type Zn2+ transport system substrate-binding protein/surface adhesin
MIPMLMMIITHPCDDDDDDDNDDNDDDDDDDDDADADDDEDNDTHTHTHIHAHVGWWAAATTQKQRTICQIASRADWPLTAAPFWFSQSGRGCARLLFL